MTKIVIFLAALTASATALAKPNYPLLASELYPRSPERQAFVAKFFEIVEAHKTHDPLLEGKGPAIAGYSLDQIKFAWIVNETKRTVDLVFFNWNLGEFKGLEIQGELSALYGKPVYILKNVLKKSIASQGERHDQLTNFSYLFGANTMEKQLRRNSPDAQIPAQMLNWKPHPGYMDRSHPLRQALDGNTLSILSPDKETSFGLAVGMEQFRPQLEAMLEARGGFYNTIMGMMVHEMFHVQESEDKVNRRSTGRQIDEDRKLIVEHLKTDQGLRRLLGTYVKIIFALGDQLKSAPSLLEREQLSDLKVILEEVKSKYPDTWKFIWDYEYTEGFAEYVSAFSMVQVKITTLPGKIDLEKSDPNNNFAYRTGALGGLYLAKRLKTMPFGNEEDHRESVWEIILRLTRTEAASVSVASLEAKYASVPGVDQDNEIDRVVEYLISTVMNLK